MYIVRVFKISWANEEMLRDRNGQLAYERIKEEPLFA